MEQKHVTNSKKILRYPIFLECKSKSKDEFWRNFYEELAYNGRYSSKYLNSKSNKVIKVIDNSINFGNIVYNMIDSNDNKKTVDDIIREVQPLINENTKFMSKIDIKNKNSKLERERTAKYKELVSKGNFSSIKIKSWRQKCIIEYIISLGKKYNIHMDELKYVYSCLVCTFLTKAHTSKDVIYKDGRITEIKGIVIEDGKIINQRINKHVEEKKSNKIKINTVQNDWEKFLQDVTKFNGEMIEE